jgi:hypothetical protein
MSDSVPSFFMLVPGPWRDEGELVTALKAADFAAKRDHDHGVQLKLGRTLRALGGLAVRMETSRAASD